MRVWERGKREVKDLRFEWEGFERLNIENWAENSKIKKDWVERTNRVGKNKNFGADWEGETIKLITIGQEDINEYWRKIGNSTVN